MDFIKYVSLEKRIRIEYQNNKNVLNDLSNFIDLVTLNVAQWNYGFIKQNEAYSYIPIETTFSLVLDFFKKYYPILYDNILDLMCFSKEKIDIKSKEEEIYKAKYNFEHGIISYVEYSFIMEKYKTGSSVNNSVLHLKYSNNICDAFALIHELFHLFYVNNDSDTWNKCFNVIGETPSILAEFTFYSFLKDDKQYDLEATKYIMDRINHFKEYALVAFLVNQLFKLYKEKRCIVKEDIQKMYESLDLRIKSLLDCSNENSLDYYLELINKLNDSLTNIFNYVLGMYSSCFLINEYSIKECVDICNKIGKYPFRKVDLKTFFYDAKLPYFKPFSKGYIVNPKTESIFYEDFLITDVSLKRKLEKK